MVAFFALSVIKSSSMEERRVAVARDVLRILSKSCFACHGPDDGVREAGLRLDVEAEAKCLRESGAAIVAQDAQASQMIARLTSSDPELVMPSPDFDRRVSAEEIELLRRWIAQGATGERHWSFAPIVKPNLSLSPLRFQPSMPAFVVGIDLRAVQLKPKHMRMRKQGLWSGR